MPKSKTDRVSSTPLRTLLIISQVYVPDPAAVGQHIADVAVEMARRGWRVVVYTSARGYDDPTVRYPSRETLNGVDVRRLPFSSFGKRTIAIRLVAQAMFLLQATIHGIFVGALQRILVSTSPPFAGFAGSLIARIRRVPLTWWVMDLNPDQMIAAGKVSAFSFSARVFDWMNRITLRRAKAVIVLDRFMEQRVLAKLPVQAKMHIIPPWPHETPATVRPSRPNSFRDEHGFADAFVIMYSGNHAIQHSLETLLQAAREFENDPHLLFVFVGGGTGKAIIESRIAEGARNIRSLPYQQLARIGESLSAGDLHVVSMGDNVVGVVHPCKIYGAMAMGRPILFFGPRDSHVGDILATSPIGWGIRHGDVVGTVAAIQEARSMPESERLAMGARAHSAVQAVYSRHLQLSRLCDVLEIAG